ncbi:hypothetical protein CBR_g44434 [Chara braunii]|uniref:Uncharacterized protein n=1 Tax=Chara braunii TaxID=69332 RepID=A0A388LXD3_CHABU|nr:hypothetical protein CBR_g44434 [Chara braunii]|eukprot:GBG86980.1 hypothetical protein CBR_g44434 [Chara braunii]
MGVYHGERGVQLIPKFEWTASESPDGGCSRSTLWIDVHPVHPWLLFSPDGQSLQVWNYEQGTRVASWLINEGYDILTAKFVVQKDWIVVRSFKSFFVYEILPGSGPGLRCVSVMEAPRGSYVHRLAVHLTLSYLLTSFEEVVVLWDWDRNWEKITFEGHSKMVNVVKFHPSDPRIFASASHDGTIKIWDIYRRCVIQTLEDPDIRWIYSLEFCGKPQKPFLISFHDSISCSGRDSLNLWVWDYRRGQRVAKLEGHNYTVKTAFFHPDLPYIFSASYGGEIRIWSDLNYQLVSSYACGLGEHFASVVACRHSTVLVFGGKGKFLLLDVSPRGGGAPVAAAPVATAGVLGGGEKREQENQTEARFSPVKRMRTTTTNAAMTTQPPPTTTTAPPPLAPATMDVINGSALGVRKRIEELENSSLRAHLEFAKRVEQEVAGVEFRCMTALEELRKEQQAKERMQAERVKQLEGEVKTMKAVMAAVVERLEHSKLTIQEPPTA